MSVKNGVRDKAVVAVGVGDSAPVMGIPGWAVCVSAAAEVPAIAVLITFGSGVDGPGGAQAWETINNTEPSKRFRILFGIFPPLSRRQGLSPLAYGTIFA